MTIYNPSDFGFGPSVGGARDPVERFKGFLVYRDPKMGFYWDDPDYGAESDDFFATIEECRADIADFRDAGEDDDVNPHADYQERDVDGYPCEVPDDTPCLDDSFHRHEMDV